MAKKGLFFALCALCVCLFFCFSGCGENNLSSIINYRVYGDADKYAAGDITYSDDGSVTSVNVDWIVGDITLICGNEFKIKELFSDLKEEKKVRSAVIGGELYVKFWKSGYSDFADKKLGEKNVEITLPQGVNLIINGVSCNVSGKTLNVKELKIDLVSGGFSCDDVVCESLDVSLISASFSAITAKVLNAVEISSVSGAQKISEFYGKVLKIESTSGAVVVGLKEFEKINAETVGGDVQINLFGAGASIEFDTVSGKLESRLPYEKRGDKYVFGDGLRSVFVETTSGSLTVTGD